MKCIGTAVRCERYPALNEPYFAALQPAGRSVQGANRPAGGIAGSSSTCQDLTYAHSSRCGAVEPAMVDAASQTMYLQGHGLDRQGFAPERRSVRFPTECQRGGVLSLPAAHFSTKLSTGGCDQTAKFSEIHRLAANLMFHFNFASFGPPSLTARCRAQRGRASGSRPA